MGTLTLGQKIKNARKSFQITQVDLARAIGVSNASISGWEADKNCPDAAALSAICQFLKLNPAYLLEIEENEMTAEEQNLLTKIRCLDKFGHRAVHALVDIEFSRNFPDDSCEDNQKESVVLPLYTMPASAGTGQFLEDGSYENVSYINPPKGSDFALRIAGDSMEPKFHHNDTVFVHKQPELADGQIGIFIFNGEGYIKSLNQEGHTLVSLNNNYSPIVITASDNLRIVGRVLGKA